MKPVLSDRSQRLMPWHSQAHDEPPFHTSFPALNGPEIHVRVSMAAFDNAHTCAAICFTLSIATVFAWFAYQSMHSTLSINGGAGKRMVLAILAQAITRSIQHYKRKTIMFNQFKAVTTISIMTLALLAAAPASSQSNQSGHSVKTPSAAPEGAGTRSGHMGEMFWTEPRMKMMDTNRDGMVSRQEYMDYMGGQYDRMDGHKKGMLTREQFMDRKMSASTFPSAAPEGAGTGQGKK